MQRLRQAIHPYLGTRLFYKGALAVMLPVTVQQLINNMFNMVDTLMVGSLDVQGLAMSAVSVANKPVVIFNGFIFGLAGAGGLMISQYFGAHNRKACLGLFWTEMILAILNAGVFFALLFFFPESIMRIFVTDPQTIALGVTYMRLISFSYFPAAISSACIFSMRPLGQNRISMLVSLGSMAVNAFCNYLFIFGSLGFPRMGVAGAALGTLIARLFEMGFYLTLMARRRMYFSFEPGACLRLDRSIRRAFFGKAVPLIVNELLYSFGLNIFFWCYARLDETALPALTIAELCYQISAVIITGNSSAVSVLIGASLGAGELDQARENSKKLLLLTLGIGFLSTLLCCGLAFLLPQFYNISDALRATATRITCIMAVFAPISFVYAFCFFCLRAGGDTRNAMLLDSGYMWAVAVPACVLMGLLLPGKLPMATAVLIVQLLMNAKLFIALHVLRQGRWVRNITVNACC
ncbi:MAG TPA: MATE family efflux transporter [Candidatus Limiplasma sp.]|nr:MATE family efflux transporter [Candidatus Limiplasma sp.]